MNNISKIAVIGGTGKAGRYIVKELLSRGYRIKLLLRFPENFQLKDPGIELLKGDARDVEAIRSLSDGCQAIISAVGQPRGEESIFSQATKNIVAAMTTYGIRRYVVLTGLNVNTPFDKKNEKVVMATEWMKTNYPKTTADKQVEYEFLTKSDIDWTLVRLPMIELTDERREVKASLEDCPSDGISAADLAYFVADQLTDAAFVGKAPFIASI
ncbi:NAD(P)H-binding protein [uncultured Imperialibacter sp.]|uniref:NAD(P)-dependent oxidoreductase n=1 Tax=uncultured Imperialibacter sp. TaxID=1672639 RepID=UPI0030DA48D4